MFFLEHSPQKKPNADFEETCDFEPKLIKYLNNIFWKHTFLSQLEKVLHSAACIMAMNQRSYQSTSKIKHHLLHTQQNSRLEVMIIIIRAIIGLKIVLTP